MFTKFYHKCAIVVLNSCDNGVPMILAIKKAIKKAKQKFHLTVMRRKVEMTDMHNQKGLDFIIEPFLPFPPLY